MPTTLSRHWQTLRLLPRYPKSITASDVHAKLEALGYDVTRHTVAADLHQLSEEFAIYEAVEKRPKQWAWRADAPPLLAPLLSHSEALTLLMAQEHLNGVLPASTLGHLQGYFDLAAKCLDPAGKQALLTPRPELRWRDKVRVLPSSQALIAPTVNAAALATVQEALLQGEQCEICYHKRRDSADKATDESKAQGDTYTVHPLGLVQRGALLYLVCTIKDYPDVKLLALHRVSSAAPLKARAVAPAGFDLDDYIASGALGWRTGSAAVVLEAAFTPQAGEHLRETPLSTDQTITVNATGELLVQATVQWTPQLEWWLLGFGAGVTVLAPAALRDKMAKTAQSMAARYTADSLK
jgi:predicted DNA-binding transcriptional regulator YafY